MEMDIDLLELEIAAIKNARVAAEIKQTENAMPTLEELRDMAAVREQEEANYNEIDPIKDPVLYAKDQLEQLGPCSDFMPDAFKDLDIGCAWTYPSNNITILDFISNIGDAPALMLLVPVAMFVLFLYMRRK